MQDWTFIILYLTRTWLNNLRSDVPLPFLFERRGDKKKSEKNAWSQVRLVEWNTSGAIFKSVIGSQDLVGRQFSPGSLYQFNLFAWHLTMGFLPPPPPLTKKKKPSTIPVHHWVTDTNSDCSSRLCHIVSCAETGGQEGINYASR